MNIIYIDIDFPSYWIKNRFYFNKHILEWVNWCGKSTCFNVIISMFTNKLCNSIIPMWSAVVKYYDWSESRLIDTVWYHPEWLNTIKSNPLLMMDNTLAKFIKVWDFFKWMSTPEQRQEITKLLNIDEESFIGTIVPGYHSNMPRDLRADIKLAEGQESILLWDIEKHQYEVIQFENTYGKHYVLPEEVNHSDHQLELMDRYQKECNAVIATRYEIAQRNMVRERKHKELENINIRKASKEEMLIKLRAEYSSTKDGVCSYCWSVMSADKYKEHIIREANAIKDEIAKLLQESNSYEISAYEDEPNLMPSKTYKEVCEYYWEQFVPVDSTSSIDTMKQKISHYHFHRDLLAQKTEQLRQLDPDTKRKQLDTVLSAKQTYTQHLEDVLKTLSQLPWVDVQLFKTRKNGTQEETFLVTYNGIPMSELSNGQALYCQFAIAHMFAQILNIPFVLFDEAWTLSEETYHKIVTYSDRQVLFARATPFKM